MKFRKASPEEMLSSCTDIGPDDGVDPRTAFRKPLRRVPNRKALQLCAQVADTLNQVFAWECGDELLEGLLVESVRPAPNSSHLLVTVALADPAAKIDPATVMQHLQRAYGLLRSEVASAIHRKRVPELTFHIAAYDVEDMT